MKYPFKNPYLNPFSIFFYLNALVLLVWVILKLFRIIETPLIFELLPTIVGLSAVFGFGAGAGKFIQIVMRLVADVKELKSDMKDSRQDLTLLKADFKYFASYRKSLTS